MILFPPDVEWGSPGKCIICESTPDRRLTPVVSCQRIFDVERPHHLAGNKYLCSDCVRTAMVVLGWSTPEEIEDNKKEIETLKEELNGLNKSFKALSNFHQATEELSSIGFSFGRSKPKPK